MTQNDKTDVIPPLSGWELGCGQDHSASVCLPSQLFYVLYCCFISSVSYIFYVFLDTMFILAFELRKMDL